MSDAVRRALAALWMTLALSTSARASDVTAPVWGGRPLSRYEEAVVSEVAADMGGELDPEPEGKVIESIAIVRLPIFDRRDVVPDFVNVVHARSREAVIRREILVGEGDRWSVERITETQRNLRALEQLSLVLLVPLRGSTPDAVRLVVITKDVWSLRLQLVPDLPNFQIRELVVGLTETNVAGTHNSLGVSVRVVPLSWDLSTRLVVPRVAGTRIRGAGELGVVFNRETGDVEGNYGSLAWGKPLESLAARWSWGVSLAWVDDVFRDYVGVDVRRYDSPETDQDDAIPIAYTRRVYDATYHLTRSWGVRHKRDLTGGFDIDLERRAPIDPELYDPRAVEDFVDTQIPRGDRRYAPFVQLSLYDGRFGSTHDVDTLALEEDYQLGYRLRARVWATHEELGSSRSVIGLETTAAWTEPLGDGLARLVVSNKHEFTEPALADALAEVVPYVASPRVGILRLVWGAYVGLRYRDYLQDRFVVGGSDRLRGYPAGAFRGKHAVLSNTELRTLPLSLGGAEWALALFHDFGDAFDTPEAAAGHHGVGLGARVLFPQLNRVVLRVDWGFPLDPAYPAFPGAVSISFGQAVRPAEVRAPFAR